MKILFIIIGILGIFSSCTSRKERLAEGEESILNEYEVEKNIFRPNSFPLKGETLYLILREYNLNNDGTKSAGSEAIRLSPKEREMIIHAYMGGQGERRKRVDIAYKKDVKKKKKEKQRPTYPIFGYWLFTDPKDGTEGQKILPYMNNVFDYDSTDTNTKYALFGDEFYEKVILTKKDQRKVDSIIEKYDLGRRYDKIYPVDKASQRMFVRTAEYEVLDTVSFNKKAMEEAGYPNQEYKVRKYCDTLPDKSIKLCQYYYDRKDKQDAFYRIEVIRPDYIMAGKIYSETGMIKEQYWAINDNRLLRIGNTYHYDCTGKLIKTVYEDKGFNISFLQFQEILWKNGYYMPNHMQNGTVHKERTISFGKEAVKREGEIPCYIYSYIDFNKEVTIKVNGVTGQIISKEINLVVD